MKINEIPTPVLRQLLRETEKVAGFDSEGARAFRDELARRKGNSENEQKEDKRQ